MSTTYLPTPRDQAAFDAVDAAAAQLAIPTTPEAILARARSIAPDAGLTLEEVTSILDSWIEIGEWEKTEAGAYRALPGSIFGVRGGAA